MTTKEIQRVNLFPNARCVPDGAQPVMKLNASVASGVVSTGLSWFRFNVDDPGSSTGAAVYFSGLGTVPGVEYVFRAKIHANGDVQVRVFDDPSQSTLADIDVRHMESVYKEGRFTALSDATRIRFSVPMIAGGYLMFAEPQLELASTYDAAVSGGGFASSPGTPCRETERNHRAGDAR